MSFPSSNSPHHLLDIAVEILKAVQKEKANQSAMFTQPTSLLEGKDEDTRASGLDDLFCLMCEGPRIRSDNKDMVFGLSRTSDSWQFEASGQGYARDAKEKARSCRLGPGECYSIVERRKALSESVPTACDPCIIKLADSQFQQPCMQVSCEHAPCGDCHNHITAKDTHGNNDAELTGIRMADSEAARKDLERMDPIHADPKPDAITSLVAATEVVIEKHLSSNVSLKIFKIEQLDALKKDFKLNSGDAETQNRIAATIKRMLLAGVYRRFIAPPKSWRHDIGQLQRQFPNFTKTIEEAIMPSLAIASAGGISRPTPLLLVGPPGIGKSYFTEMLGAMLGVPMVNIDMASASMGSSIGGLAAHWANSGPGEVFKTLALGKSGREAVSNPLIVLDETDKVSPEHRYDPLGPLYTLLETISARKFIDESIPAIQMDASHIRWILCANDSKNIPKAILSRVHEIYVNEPTRSEREEMFVRIFANVVEDSGLNGFDPHVPPAVIQIAHDMGPREFKTKSVMALGNALLSNRMRVGDTDFVVSTASKRPRMGFR